MLKTTNKFLTLVQKSFFQTISVCRNWSTNENNKGILKTRSSFVNVLEWFVSSKFTLHYMLAQKLHTTKSLFYFHGKIVWNKQPHSPDPDPSSAVALSSPSAPACARLMAALARIDLRAFSRNCRSNSSNPSSSDACKSDNQDSGCSILWHIPNHLSVYLAQCTTPNCYYQNHTNFLLTKMKLFRSLNRRLWLKL